VHYLRDVDGAVLTPGDTGAEEESWRARGLSIALAMDPRHAHAQRWFRWLVLRQLAAYARPSDVRSPTALHRSPLCAWLGGSNAEEDGSLQNHGYLPQPNYMRPVHHLVAVTQQRLAGQAVSPSALHGVEHLYSALRRLYREDGGLDYPAGTDVPSRVVVLYANDALHRALGLGGAAAQRWEDLHGALAEQQVQPDGSVVEPGGVELFGPVQPDIAVKLAECLLASRLGRLAPDEVDGSALAGPPPQTVPTGCSGVSRSFPDTADAVAAAASWLHGRGVLLGLPDGSFAPGRTVDRATAVVSLFRVAGSPVTAAPHGFGDAPSDGGELDRALRWGVAEGLVRGTGPGTVAPRAGLTRSQAVVLLWRAQGRPEAPPSGFTDVQGEVAAAASWARAAGITQGRTPTTFDPGAGPHARRVGADAAPTARRRLTGAAQSRATPSSRAACATASATAGATRGSNGLGMTQSADRSSPTTAASASAAAIFMPSVMRRARTAMAPLKTPGKASTLLIWFGKSERPVATTAAPAACATSGCTSGSGLAMANTMESFAIERTASAGTVPEDRPTSTSAPSSASMNEPVWPLRLLIWANMRFSSLRSSRPRWTMPLLSATARSPMPASSTIRETAMPAAPGAADDHPHVAERATGEPSRRCAGGEHDDRGAVLVVVEDRDVEPGLQPALDLEAAGSADVLEVDAAEGRREPGDGVDEQVDVGDVEADRHGVDAAELLEQQRLALHDRQRGLGPDVTEPQHGGAVGDDGDGVRLPRVVVDQRAVLRDGGADARDPRRVGQRQVLAGLQRHRTRRPRPCRRGAGRRPGRGRGRPRPGPASTGRAGQGPARCGPPAGRSRSRTPRARRAAGQRVGGGRSTTARCATGASAARSDGDHPRRRGSHRRPPAWRPCPPPAWQGRSADLHREGVAGLGPRRRRGARRRRRRRGHDHHGAAGRHGAGDRPQLSLGGRGGHLPGHAEHHAGDQLAEQDRREQGVPSAEPAAHPHREHVRRRHQELRRVDSHPVLLGRQDAEPEPSVQNRPQ
jgi:hypothetical protein